jgi:hypothetical protein
VVARTLAISLAVTAQPSAASHRLRSLTGSRDHMLWSRATNHVAILSLYIVQTQVSQSHRRHVTPTPQIALTYLHQPPLHAPIDCPCIYRQTTSKVHAEAVPECINQRSPTSHVPLRRLTSTDKCYILPCPLLLIQETSDQ